MPQNEVRWRTAAAADFQIQHSSGGSTLVATSHVARRVDVFLSVAAH